MTSVHKFEKVTFLYLGPRICIFFDALLLSGLGFDQNPFKTNEKKQSIFDKILTVLLGYILIPLILCIPFYFSIYNLTLLNSYFETVSGFTSTGFTIFENIKNIDRKVINFLSSY